jgi:biopolymer transport protein ExbD
MRIQLGEEEAEGDEGVQMAPLIDCVFLLLCFFLVTAALREIHVELPLDLPDAGACVKAKAVDNTIVISVTKDGAIHLADTPVNTRTLLSKLRAHAKMPNARVRVDGDRACAFQHIAYVLDLCQFEGLNNVGVRTRDPERPGRK